MNIPKRKSFIALFDILGFRDLLTNENVGDVYNVATRVKSLIDNVNDMGKHLRALLKGEKVTTLNYSDTFLMYTADITNLQQRHIDRVFHALLVSCDSLFIAANENKMPIRGAITFGDIIVSDDIVLGKPIVDAYEIEKNQEWIGCTISSLAMRTISKEARSGHSREKAIIDYTVPCKNGIVKKLSAYNWTRSDPFRKGDYSILQKRGRGDWAIERKHRNTWDFIKYVSKQ